MELEIRNAQFIDADYLFKLANDPETRKNSFVSREIVWDEHINWVQNSLKDPNRYIFIISSEEDDVGIVKFEIREEVVIGVTIDPRFRGKGLGGEIIKKGCLKFWEKNARDINAYIKTSNIASVKAFKKANFSFLETVFINGINSQKFIAHYHAQ